MNKKYKSKYKSKYKFIAEVTGARVRFGDNAKDVIVDEIKRLNAKNVMLISTPEQKNICNKFKKITGKLAKGTYTNAQMHTPVEITKDAINKAKTIKADCVVAIGGGSTTGLAKAIAYKTNMPQIIIPTTYAGSEATPILGQTENNKKVTVSHPKILPEVIIYDPKLTTGLPIQMSVNSGLNAIAHAVEAIYAKDKNPITTITALKGIEAFVSSLPVIVREPKNINARTNALLGAWLCGTVLGQVGMSLHHKLCHTIGGMLNLDHAQTHAVILPHAIAYNEQKIPEILKPIAEMLNANTAAEGMFGFAKKINAPTKLKNLGVKKNQIELVAQQATLNPYWNPKKITKNGIKKLLTAAWNGNNPKNTHS